MSQHRHPKAGTAVVSHPHSQAQRAGTVIVSHPHSKAQRAGTVVVPHPFYQVVETAVKQQRS